MEDTAEVEVSPKKLRNTRSDSVKGGDQAEEKSESGKIIHNGTGNISREDVSEEDNVKQKGKAIKITKISKSSKTTPVKDNPKNVTASPSKKAPESPTKPAANSSPSSSLSSEDFLGFSEITESSEVLRKKEAFDKFISSLEDVGDKEEASEGEEEGGETMTAEDGDAADSDSNQMEIDEGNSHEDSGEFGDKNDKGRTRDSDVDVMEVDSVKSAEDPLKIDGAEVEGAADNSTAPVDSEPVPKVEYCGTCSEVVDDAEEGICCDGKCERWFHLQCSGLTQAEYDELSRDENAKWACSKCSGKPPPEIKPGAKPLLTVRKDLTATPSPKRRSIANREDKRPRVDISNPIFLKPFDYGWKRELVFRSTNDSQAKKQGDVYYYTPKGKKLRSLREISEHLLGTDLTVDNFTFWKDALGCDPDKEIIRDAKMKLANKDSSTASPGPASAKKVGTPKTPKTPKTTPKLTATVTPLDSASGLPVAKASASVTPRVVLKTGKTGSNSTGPKFKVTPSKTVVTPGQAQKIVISKGGEKTSCEKQFPKNVDTTNNGRRTRSQEQSCAKDNNQVTKDNIEIGTNDIENEGENVVNGVNNQSEDMDIVTITKNKFRRYGLLANRISTRTNVRNRRSKSSSSSSSSCSEDLTTPEKEIKASLKSKMDSIKAAGLNLKESVKSQSGGTGNKGISPMSTFMYGAHNPPPPLTLDTMILPNLSKRPRSPEIQFRPSDPSSYGCQTVATPIVRSVGPKISSSKGDSFETVLIVDTSPEHSVNSPKRRTASQRSSSPVQWTQDCSIQVFSVETLPSRDSFSNESYILSSPTRKTGLPPKKQNSFIRAVEGNKIVQSSGSKDVIDCSPESIRSSSTDVVVIEEDIDDCSSPPFLVRNSPPPKLVKNTASPNNSPPSLQANLSPPPLVSYSSFLSNSSRQNLAAVNSMSSLAPSEETIDSNETGSKFDAYRKLKRERYRERWKAKRELERLKRSYQEERKLFISRKSEEKRLQIEYLRLKVKIKAMKLSLMKKRSDPC